MDLKIIEERINAPIGKRREITFTASYEGKTATNEELKVALCKKLNISPASTMIIKIDQQYGSRNCTGIAHSYESEEEMKRIEPKHLLKRAEKREQKEASAEDKG
ncbi:MAG: hypothetical protein M1448_01040 [Candidatus Marsarchaeota archaeon]|jgi:ribosomal protein S24E|nr:hypothetical protein [Candidatus Marsarchaeota archaeon]